ncbi:hypothetical protein ABOZ73_08220 [Caulobacter sp. 73W]|uniref:DUF4267 domain-containing protein n=1 Tax=Caulobacter sp. 73W TaxID=3161137 RepID=A0AB39KXM1_9CAUL
MTSEPPTHARRRKSATATSSSSESRPWEAPATALNAGTPYRTFRLPGGKAITLATDRVRAKPAVSPQISMGLGQNAIGLGLWGLLAPRSVNRFLGLRSSAQTTRLVFGAREMATGVALASDPTKASALWARVLGDVFDIAVLSHAVRRSNPKRGNARLAMAVVLGVTVLDLVAAWRMTDVKRNCA